eukprot:Hpha_TRINITY_DN11372_c0_g1::TRINITY_DN11372_c0_g1_i1::g.63095::m.63095
MYVVRHGERVDEVEPDWVARAERPYDPPVTDTGRAQADQLGRLLVAREGAQRPVHVVSSPFTRCVQTAERIVSVLREAGPDGELLVSNALSEVMSPEVLKTTTPPSLPELSLPLAEPVALAEFPERREAAMERYDSVLGRAGGLAQLAGASFVLVTHGEAVGRAVAWQEPGATVFAVDLCGFVCLRRRGCGEWELQSASGESGVQWFSDAGVVT